MSFPDPAVDPMLAAGVSTPVLEPEAARAEVRTTPATAPSLIVYGPLHTLVSTLRFMVGVIFVFTFIVQPFRIPSASMYPTLKVGDFLLVNKAIFAPGGFWRWVLPYRAPHDGDIVVFHFPEKPTEYLVKRVIGAPGDDLHLQHGRVVRDGHWVSEPYAFYMPSAPDRFRDEFPAVSYNYPGAGYDGWLRMRRDFHDGQLDVPSRRYFVLGDNRNDSRDSRYWGLVPRQNIVGRPLVIYFSLHEPSLPGPATDDKLNQKSGLFAGLLNFARWRRIFDVVH